MRNLCYTFLFLSIIGCIKPMEKEIQLLEVEYGRLDNVVDSLSVEIDPSGFEHWSALVNRMEDIVCNDSIPKITLTLENKIKKIYFSNFCWEHYGCILIRERNVIEIHNNTISKTGKDLYPIDSLECFIKRDVENYGTNPSLCDHPDRLLFSISYDDDQMECLFELLDNLTEIYARLTNRTDIKIVLVEKYNYAQEIPQPE